MDNEPNDKVTLPTAVNARSTRTTITIKFGVAVVRGPLDVVPMTRLKVDEGSTALHVVADALSCTSVEAQEQISRLEAFTSFAGEGKTALEFGS